MLILSDKNDEQIIDEIIDSYIQLPARGSRQQRQEKTHQEWKRILQRESRNGFGQISVLVHRVIRTSGKAYLSTKQVFVSSNFVVYTMSSYEEALLLSTWMTTIFYQLICEVTSKDQEGMRKMGVADINKPTRKLESTTPVAVLVTTSRSARVSLRRRLKKAGMRGCTHPET